MFILAECCIVSIINYQSMFYLFWTMMTSCTWMHQAHYHVGLILLTFFSAFLF